MFRALKDPAAIAAANQYFDDLIALVDPATALPHLRPTVEDFRYETLHCPDMLRTPHHLRGFLWGLMAADKLTLGQMNELTQRLDHSRIVGWL